MCTWNFNVWKGSGEKDKERGGVGGMEGRRPDEGG